MGAALDVVAMESGLGSGIQSLEPLKKVSASSPWLATETTLQIRKLVSVSSNTPQTSI